MYEKGDCTKGLFVRKWKSSLFEPFLAIKTVPRAITSIRTDQKTPKCRIDASAGARAPPPPTHALPYTVAQLGQLVSLAPPG